MLAPARLFSGESDSGAWGRPGWPGRTQATFWGARHAAPSAPLRARRLPAAVRGAVLREAYALYVDCALDARALRPRSHAAARGIAPLHDALARPLNAARIVALQLCALVQAGLRPIWLIARSLRFAPGARFS